MQFHINGFRPGDPNIAEPLPGAQHADTLPPAVDVLIIGCGPTGLTLAAQLAAFPDITTAIIEQKAGPLQLGQADGIACRTMEMFEAFGFADRVLREAYYVNETAFWKPKETTRSEIVRSGRIQDVEDGLSEMPHVILNQARVHDFYLDVMRNSASHLEPHYQRQFLDLAVAADNGASTHPVTVRLERIDPRHKGQVETVKARFVVGCDGARSAVRKALGRELVGDSANQAWGVMDVLAVTDFPDVRLKCLIQSAEGSALIIPREGGFLFRIYIEIDKLKADERVSSLNVTSERLISAARRILHPYTLEVKEVAWWSVYEIGQRLCDRFDDLREGEDRTPRVFIAGDACHTHSPKAGQGMNMSMQDTFNLGWKLAVVLRGRSAPRLLMTYSQERQTIAKDLIDFDRMFAKLISAPPRDPANPTNEGVDPAELQQQFVRQGRFTAGVVTQYRPSMVIGEPTYQHLAAGFPIGARFHSAPVVRLADAKPMHLGHTVKADGRWRLFAFAAAEDPADPSSHLHALCRFLGEDADSPVRKYTREGEDIDSVIDVRSVVQQGHRDLALEAMPAFLLPRKGRYGLRDYEKLFCPDLKNGHDIFDMRGVDRAGGCMVIVRPDQYVAHILPLDGFRELAAFFGGFMLT
jgi:phenol 2-monooxygenase (NADPH)